MNDIVMSSQNKEACESDNCITQEAAMGVPVVAFCFESYYFWHLGYPSKNVSSSEVSEVIRFNNNLWKGEDDEGTYK